MSLSFNRFEGDVAILGAMPQLTLAVARGNAISGALPSKLASRSLYFLDLSDNKVRELSHCTIGLWLALSTLGIDFRDFAIILGSHVDAQPCSCPKPHQRTLAENPWPQLSVFAGY